MPYKIMGKTEGVQDDLKDKIDKINKDVKGCRRSGDYSLKLLDDSRVQLTFKVSVNGKIEERTFTTDKMPDNLPDMKFTFDIKSSGAMKVNFTFDLGDGNQISITEDTKNMGTVYTINYKGNEESLIDKD